MDLAVNQAKIEMEGKRKLDMIGVPSKTEQSK